MKFPKLPPVFSRKERKRLNATTATRRAAPPVDDYSDEPQTKFSSAFIVVLILHVVAVAGIYAFKGVKAHRKEVAEALSTSGVTSGATSGSTSGSTSDASAVPSVAATVKSPAVNGATAVSASLVKHSSPATLAPMTAAVAPISGAHVHQVKSGETLAKIATLYGVSSADLEESNGAKNVATLRAGQILNIPKVKTAGAGQAVKDAVAKKTEDAPKVAATTKPGAKTYVVAKGDNPLTIARKLGVNQEELLKLNNIEDPKKLQPGQTLKVPASKKN